MSCRQQQQSNAESEGLPGIKAIGPMTNPRSANCIGSQNRSVESGRLTFSQTIAGSKQPVHTFVLTLQHLRTDPVLQAHTDIAQAIAQQFSCCPWTLHDS